MQNNQPTDIIFTCPHCHHAYSDDMECLHHNSLHEITCESCEETFLFLLEECLACGEEASFSWRSSGEVPDSSELRCAHCGKALLMKVEDGNAAEYDC